MTEPRRRRSVSSAYLLDLLAAQLGEQYVPARADIVDIGGGTGGVATWLAGRGHQVTVVDPSPDALASLHRRASEAGLTGSIRGVQGDAADIVDIIGPASVDVVVCHRVLEVVDSPAEALTAMARVLRGAGVLSLLVSQRHSMVLSQAISGHFSAARRTYADVSRFDTDTILALVAQAGFTTLDVHGIGSISDHVPETLVESDPGSYAELYALEAETSQDPAFRAVAPVLHLLARPRAAAAAG